MAPTDADTPIAASFGIQLPPGWWELPVDQAGPDPEVLDALCARWPDLSEQRRQQLGEHLRGLSAQARSHGVLLCGQGVMADNTGDIVPAGVVVSRAPVVVAPWDLEVQVEALARRGFPGPADPPPRECSVVLLPRAGQAIRVRGSSPTAGELNSVNVQFFVPVPGNDTTALVAFGSPVLIGHEPYEELVELFDAMAETFCFMDVDGQPLQLRSAL